MRSLIVRLQQGGARHTFGYHLLFVSVMWTQDTHGLIPNGYSVLEATLAYVPTLIPPVSVLILLLHPKNLWLWVAT